MARKYNPTPTFDFLKWRRPLGLVSGILCVISVMLIFFPGPKFNVDFTGGTNIVAKFDGAVQDQDVHKAMASIGIHDAQSVHMGAEGSGEYVISTSATTTVSDKQRAEVTELLRKKFGSDTEVKGDASSGDRLYVRMPAEAYNLDSVDDAGTHLNLFTKQSDAIAKRIDETLDTAAIPEAHTSVWGNPSDRRFLVRVAGMHDTVQKALQDAFGEHFIEIERTESVGPRVGKQLRAAAITAVLWSMVLILIYIAFRFDMRFAPAAVIGELHDILIVMGFIVIFRIDFSLTIIAALLTIIGYSVNDTIVNFDRVRENLQAGDMERRGETLPQLVNRSVNECLSRTLLTGLTTIAALIAIVIFGGNVLRPFAIVMAFGVFMGAYSSVYISEPLMLWTSDIIERRKAKQPARESAPKHNGPVV